VNACLGHHCRSGEVSDGVQQCVKELNENSGPMAQSCKRGCTMTEKMKTSDCTHEFDTDLSPPPEEQDPNHDPTLFAAQRDIAAARKAAQKRGEL